MDGVKVALGKRGMTVEAARQCANDRKEWRALVLMQLNEFHARDSPGTYHLRPSTRDSPGTYVTE